MTVAPDIIEALGSELMRDGHRLAEREIADALARVRIPFRAPDHGTETDLRIEDMTTGGPQPVPVRVYTPQQFRSAGVLVNVHGGGWVAGSIEQDDHRCRVLARRVGCIVISVGYRLAPEHPFPAGIEDCVAAIRWAQHRAQGLDVAVLGASAGANLAVAAMLRLAAMGDALPAFQLLLYPMCDAADDFLSYVENATGYFLTSRDVAWYWRQYMAESDPTNPLASILRSPDLARLPPGLIVVCQHDPLRDEGEALAAKLSVLGVPTSMTVYPDTIHGFVSFAPASEAGQLAFDAMTLALRAAFGKIENAQS